ncbi:MAG: hypothetical protein ABW110_13460 [Steroidobacteraceae bacterium]
MWNSDRRANALRQLHALNRRFITNLLAEHDAGLPGPALTPHFVPLLRGLDAAATHELCATPYTLYDLPFGNETYWHETAQLNPNGERAASGLESPQTARRYLTELTLFLAWHVAINDAAGARLFFGMSGGALEFFRQADVATLGGVATQAAQVLQPRWQNNPYFWPELIRSVGTDHIRLQATRLLGAQLLASELCDERVVLQAPRRLRKSILRRTSEVASVTVPPVEQSSPAVLAPL